MADKELREIFGKNLKYWLAVRGYKQADLSRRFGVSSATASDWCNGNKMPRADKLKAICSWLDIELSNLMTDSSEVRTDGQRSGYYIDEETAKAAQEMFENKELKALFDVTRDFPPEDLLTVYNVAIALKRKGEYNGDDPA